jgi:hypothetical protein
MDLDLAGRVAVVNNAGGPPPGTKLPRFGFSTSLTATGGRCSSSISSRPSAPAAPRSR